METVNKIKDEEERPRSNVSAYLDKMKGGNRPKFEKSDYREHFITALGSFLGIGLVALLNYFYQIPLIVPSFGASAVLLYAACHAPMSQPRNVIGGHLVSATTSVAVYQSFGIHWWSIALGVTLAILFMSLTHTLHPPGGATAFIGVYTEQSWSYIFSPVGVGAILLVLVAVVVNNLSSKRKYPHFWF